MKPKFQTAKEKLKETNKQVFLQTASLINSALALVAALAWNEAIKAIIDRFIPAGSALYSQVLYALIVTVIVVLVSMRLTRVIARYTPEDDENK